MVAFEGRRGVLSRTRSRCFSVTTEMSLNDVPSRRRSDADKPFAPIMIGFFDLCHKPARRTVFKVNARGHIFKPCISAKV